MPCHRCTVLTYQFVVVDAEPWTISTTPWPLSVSPSTASSSSPPLALVLFFPVANRAAGEGARRRLRGHRLSRDGPPCPAPAQSPPPSIPVVSRLRGPSCAPNRAKPPSRPRRRHRRIRRPQAPVAATIYTATLTVSASVSRPFSPSGLSPHLPRRHSRAPPPPSSTMCSPPATWARALCKNGCAWTCWSGRARRRAVWCPAVGTRPPAVVLVAAGEPRVVAWATDTWAPPRGLAPNTAA